MKEKTMMYLLSLLLFAVFIVPFFYVIQFTYMSGDDFCRAVTGIDQYFKNIAHWFTHNGRYTNGFLSYIPVYGKETYRWTLFLSMGMFLGALFYFVRRTLRLFHYHLPISTEIFITALFSVLIFSQLPDYYEFFYWYAAVTVYQYSFILFLFLLPRLLGYYKGITQNYIITGLLIILLIGNNEMFMLVTNFLLGLLLLVGILINREINYKILLMNIISWIASLIVVLTPGTEAKQTHYPEGGDIILSLKGSILSSGMFILKSLTEFPYVLVYMLLLVYLVKVVIKRKEEVQFINPILLFLISYIAFLLVFFVPLYAIGHIAVNIGRIGNVVHIFFLILLFINLVNLSNYLCHFKINFKIPGTVLGALIVVFLIGVVFTGNYNYLMLDLKGDSLENYEQQLEKRHLLLKQAKGIVNVKSIENTNLLRYHDVTRDTTNWQNHCYVEMINYRFGTNIQEIILDL